jgi:FemAB-related protein (PEP-CTERM system-associated)
MPFVNYGGPLGSDRAVRALTDEVLKIAQRDRVELLELRSRRRLPLSLPVSHRKLTVLVDLAGNPEVVWKSLSTKTRTKVRRSRKCGVEVHIGPDELRPFYHVFARHMRDLGTPSQSEQFFRSIQETFPESVRFGCAYLDGVPIAGGCGFRWGEEFEITWSSALRTHNKVRSNYLLHWSFMESAAREGCTTYNFGRSTPGSGTHEFKRQWSGRDVPLWWYHVGRAGVSQTPSPDQGRYSWGPRIWRRLPLRLAMTLGPRIVRCIP